MYVCHASASTSKICARCLRVERQVSKRNTLILRYFSQLDTHTLRRKAFKLSPREMLFHTLFNSFLFVTLQRKQRRRRKKNKKGFRDSLPRL
jgi:hypothetical protein